MKKLSVALYLMAWLNCSWAAESIITFVNGEQADLFWSPISDQIRGGLSTISMELKNDQSASFFGELKLNENNAGFASFRVKKEDGSFWNLQKKSALQVVSRGDGRTYKLLVKDEAANAAVEDYSWQALIPTSKNFKNVNLKISDLKPIYRGRIMKNVKPLDSSKIVEFGFQINDKKEGPFELNLKSLNAL